MFNHQSNNDENVVMFLKTGTFEGVGLRAALRLLCPALQIVSCNNNNIITMFFSAVTHGWPTALFSGTFRL